MPLKLRPYGAIHICLLLLLLLHISGVSVRTAADQNLLPLTGSTVRVTQRSCLTKAAELVDFR